MLQLSDSFVSKSVLSLRTGAPVARVLSPIINPDNLKIEGFYCEDKFSKNKLVLLCQDIRDTSAQGYFVNDHEVMSEPEELVRLKKVLDIDFKIIGKPVVTTSRQKVGKVGDYAYDTSSMYIQKIYVGQSLFKSLTGGNLSVDRTQVQEITPKTIVINELMNKSKLRVSPLPTPL